MLESKVSITELLSAQPSSTGLASRIFTILSSYLRKGAEGAAEARAELQQLGVGSASGFTLLRHCKHSSKTASELLSRAAAQTLLTLPAE